MPERPFPAQEQRPGHEADEAKLYELEMQKKNAEKQAMEETNPTSAGAARFVLMSLMTPD